MKQNNKKGMNAAKLMKHRAAKGRGGQQKQHDGLDRSSPDTIASLVDAWLQRLKERNYSERTLSMNRGALRQFLEWSEQRDLRRARAVHQDPPRELPALPLALEENQRRATRHQHPTATDRSHPASFCPSLPPELPARQPRQRARAAPHETKGSTQRA